MTTLEARHYAKMLMEVLPPAIWAEAIFNTLGAWIEKYRENVLPDNALRKIYNESCRMEFERRDQERFPDGNKK